MDRMKKNHGQTVESLGNGTKFVEAYGKDNSDVTGKAKHERSPHSMGGSINNLSHSLSGTSANQKGS
jgi:hypothetical protein